MLEQLFSYNQRAAIIPPEDDWCGSNLRIGLHAIYTLAFVCLLRVDEVLHIQLRDLKWEQKDGAAWLHLELRFRKTHQFGGGFFLVFRP